MIKAKIGKIHKDSIAEELEIEVGDFLIKIDGNDINDIVEYEHKIYKEFLEIEILKKDINEIWEFEIEKDAFEDLGMEFEEAVFDGVRTCKNNCIFCFVAQLPKKDKLRKSLYLKDEDFRLSFLYGSYMTLSNLTDEDFKRIINERLSPLYISVHATDSEVRKQLLNNPKEKDMLKKLKRLCDNGIELHTQAVLIPGLNDGEVLEKTIDDLISLHPMVKTLTIVPVGLTKYHKQNLRIYKKEESKKVVEYVLKRGEEIKEKYDTSFMFLADEFFSNSEINVPTADYYEGFEHLENGVGLLRILLDEAEALEKNYTFFKEKVSLACGKSVYPYIKNIFKEYKNINIEKIESYFWGENVTVSGLITASDLIKNLGGKELGEKLFISRSMLNSTEFFLDNYTIKELEDILKVKIVAISSIKEMFEAI